MRLACSKAFVQLQETPMILFKGEVKKPRDFPKSCFFFVRTS